MSKANVEAFKFPTTLSVATKQACDALLELAIEAKPLVQGLIKGHVLIVESDKEPRKRYAFTTIDESGKIDYERAGHIDPKEFKAQIKGCPLVQESTLHLDGEWAGADDGRLRRVVYAKGNQAALDNAYRTAQVIESRPVVRGTKLVANTAPGVLAVEHEIQPRMPHTFNELSLMTVFKFINEDDKTTLAIKVGRSTAITGIQLDANKNLVNVATYNFNGTKIRLKKNIMVVKIE